MASKHISSPKRDIGYKAHIKRILYSGGQVMRTIKYPLTLNCNNSKREIFHVPHKLISAVQHDDLYIRGPANLNDYINPAKQNIYTVIKFWIDSLRVGIVWMPSSATLKRFVYTIFKADPVELIWHNGNEILHKYFDKQQIVKNVILNSGWRSTGIKTIDKLYIKLLTLIKKEYVDSETNIPNNDELKDLVKEWADFLWDKSQNKIKSTRIQEVFWKQNLNIDKSIIQVQNSSLTFFVIPELYEQGIKLEGYSLETIEKLINLRKQWLNNINLDFTSVEELLGLTDNFNAYSNYFNEVLKLLKANRANDLTGQLKRVYPELNINQQQIIKQAMEYLAAKVQHLEEPQFPGVNNWADYRSLIGGKIQSWYSNFTRRQSEIETAVNELLAAIEQVQIFINQKPIATEYNINEYKDRKNLIVQFLNDIQSMIIKYGPKLSKDLLLYNDFFKLLTEARKELNVLWAKYYKKQDSKNDSEKIQRPQNEKLLKAFFEVKIYKPMSFYGTVQLERNKKIVEKTIPIIKQGIKNTKQFIDLLLESVDWSFVEQEQEGQTIRQDAGLRRLLNILRNKILNKAINSTLIKDIILRILTQYTTSEQILGKEQLTFYKSTYSTSNQHEIELNVNSYSDEAQKIINVLINNVVNNYPVDELLKNSELLIDWIEISKITIARLLRWQTDKNATWDLNDFDFSEYQAVTQRLRSINSQKVTLPQLQYIINSLFYGEFRGTAVMFSKQGYKAKYNIQFIGSDKKLELAIVSKRNDSDIHNSENIYKTLKLTNPYDKKRAKLPEQVRWYINFKDIIDPNGYLPNFQTSINTTHTEIITFDKKTTPKKTSSKFLLNICTSYEQLQFLERLLYKPKSWKNIKISLSEPSIIVEQEYNIKWDLDSQKPILELAQTNKPSLYYALPITVASSYSNKNAPLARVKGSKDPSTYWIVGVDVGEYGLAWVATKISENNIHVDNYGFIFDNQIAKIQKKFSEIQQKAKKGIFLGTSTVIAELRENAVGHLRNVLHFYLTKLEGGGQIIYETNISNFETGSGRVTKIYDTVKKADVGNYHDQSDAYKSLVKHVWGINTGKKNLPGWQVPAYASSYTCIKCGTSVYQINDNDNFEIKAYMNGNDVKPGQIIKLINTKTKQEWLGYLHKNNSTITKKLIKGKNARKIIKAFARPPLTQNSLVAHKFIIDKHILNANQLEHIHNTRGNSAIFVCPNPKCSAVADADIQAALIMAIRGYLRIKDYLSKKDEKDYKPEMFSRSLEFLRKILKSGHITGKIDFLYSAG